MSALVGILESQTGNAALGTGVVPLLDKAKTLLGGKIPEFLISYAMGLQNAIFGRYPDHKDVAPSAVFTAVFIIIMFAHLGVFLYNYRLGHRFWLSIGFAFYALIRWIGFAMRIVWAKDILKLKVGMASEVFLIIPTIFLCSFNLVLAQRIFTWRHPVGGSHKLFWAFMIAVYAVVVAVVVMTIVAAMVPYNYFLSQKHYDMCKNVVKVLLVLVCLYSLLALALVGMAFVFKPTEKDRAMLTYQPWWIKSFSPLYFPEQDACRKAEEQFARLLPEHRDAVRVIPSSDAHFGELEGLGSDRGELRHNASIFLIALTTVIIFVGAIIRCITNFMNKTDAEATDVFKPVVMYIVWGLLETIVNVLYLVGRVDLRFYRPDRLSRALLETAASSAEVGSTLPKQSPLDESEHEGAGEGAGEDANEKAVLAV